MAYTKTNWVNGQTPINADNLNKIEEGIEESSNKLEGIKDHVIEQGNLDGWSYSKRNSGVCEAWKTVTLYNVPVTIASVSYGGYRSDALKIPYPADIFKSVTTVNGTKQNLSAASIKGVEVKSDGTIAFAVSSGSSETINISIGLYVLGTWK